MLLVSGFLLFPLRALGHAHEASWSCLGMHPLTLPWQKVVFSLAGKKCCNGSTCLDVKSLGYSSPDEHLVGFVPYIHLS
jgi:hypothetical protein